jgi:hypothetical protein
VRIELTYEKVLYTVAVREDGSAIMLKGGKPFAYGWWRYNYVRWGGERNLPPYLLDEIDRKLRLQTGNKKEWDADFRPYVEEESSISSPSGFPVTLGRW